MNFQQPDIKQTTEEPNQTLHPSFDKERAIFEKELARIKNEEGKGLSPSEFKQVQSLKLALEKALKITGNKKI